MTPSVPFIQHHRRLAVLSLLTALLLQGCGSVAYQRETLTLNADDIDQFSIKYGELSGCILQQQVPLQYGVARPQYAMVVGVIPASTGDSPGLEITLKGQSKLHARFPDLERQPTGSVDISASRYRINTADLPYPVLRLDVMQDERTLGTEQFTFTSRKCTAYGWG